MADSPINTALSARDIYDNGTPQPGVILRHDPATLIIAGAVKSTTAEIHFGRVVAPFTLDASNNKLFENIDDAVTKAGGIAVFSNDAIAGAADGFYSAKEAISVLERGFVVVETDAALVTTDTLTVSNGDGSGDPEDIGKLSKSTGAGFSTVTNLRITKVFSSSLVEVEITGPIALTPLS
jgi:hypothetical protein